MILSNLMVKEVSHFYIFPDLTAIWFSAIGFSAIGFSAIERADINF